MKMYNIYIQLDNLNIKNKNIVINYSYHLFIYLSDLFIKNTYNIILKNNNPKLVYYLNYLRFKMLYLD